MGTVHDTLQEARELLAGARIAKGTREQVNRKLSVVSMNVGELSTGAEKVASPLVPTDSYAGRYYWPYRDRATARMYSHASTKVRAVNIDRLSDHDLSEGRSPSSWTPAVEVTFTTNDHTLTGDLSAREATRLAMMLLQAADTLQG